MAHASLTFWGPVITLNHQETIDVTEDAETVAGIVHRIGSALSDTEFALVGFCLEAVAFGISLNAFVVRKVDQGNGVYITSPWVALGSIIPTTYPGDVGLPQDWAGQPSGAFKTNDLADLLKYEIQPHAVSDDIVEFQLQAYDTKMWRKVLVMRDGLGSQWDIPIDPSQGTASSSNTLWADQVKNGQDLSLWKAKEFGIMTWVLDIGHLENVPPGARVTFEWVED
jgi:hypothetical protein